MKLTLFCVCALVASAARDDPDADLCNEDAPVQEPVPVQHSYPIQSPMCADRHQRCGDHEHICGIQTYRIMMVRTCATTCGFCQEAQALAASCRDSHPFCQARRNICFHPTYKVMMARSCAQTCLYC